MSSPEKKSKYVLTGFILALIFFGLNLKSSATSYQAAELTYLCTAPNIYVISARVYRDCAGPALQNSETLIIKSNTCSASRTVTMQLVQGTVSTGINYYCPSMQGQALCTATAPLPNFEAGTYRVTVTFNAAETQCPDLLLSLTLNSRTTTENLVGNAPLYTEAYLKFNNNIYNNSPEFAPTNMPVVFACRDQEFTYATNAAEPDGDSLSYELVKPLTGPASTVTYAVNTNGNAGTIPPGTSMPFVMNGTCMVYNANVAAGCSLLYKSSPFDPRPLPLQTAVLPMSFCNGTGGPNSNYSVSYPIPVAGISIDWVNGCRTNIPVVNGGFTLDQVNGIIRFKPSVYNANTPSSAGRNKYAVAVQIHEWRKINGIMTKVGSIRREIMIIVSDCTAGSSNLPHLTVIHPAPLQFPQDSVFNVQTCTTVKYIMKWRDNDTTDILDVSFPDAVFAGSGSFIFPNIPGLVMKQYANNRKKVDVVFYMTPTAGDAGKNYFLRAVAKDNGCPATSRIENVFRIHINASNRLAVAGSRDRTIALGQSTQLNMMLMRPDSVMQNNQLIPAPYAYHWAETNATGGLPDGMNPADRNKKDVIVSPTRTTRYFLAATSNLAGCADTASVLVRVNGATGSGKDEISKTGFTAFPNPFENDITFRIENPAGTGAAVLIYNMLGREIDRLAVAEPVTGEVLLNWSGSRKQPAGQYFARLITSAGIIQTIKFSKNH